MDASEALEEIRDFEKQLAGLFKAKLRDLLEEELDNFSSSVHLTLDEETKETLSQLLEAYDLELYGIELNQQEFNVTYSFGHSYRSEDYSHSPRFVKFSINDDESWYNMSFQLRKQHISEEIYASMNDEFFNIRLIAASTVSSVIKNMKHNFVLLSLKAK